MMKTFAYAIAIFLAQTVAALSPAEWRGQSIYFLLTDRFARADNSTTAPCDVTNRVSFSTVQVDLANPAGLLRRKLAGDHQPGMMAR